MAGKKTEVREFKPRRNENTQRGMRRYFQRTPRNEPHPPVAEVVADPTLDSSVVCGCPEDRRGDGGLQPTP